MTLNDWFTLLGILQWARNSESCADSMIEEEIDDMIKKVKKEIDRLK